MFEEFPDVLIENYGSEVNDVCKQRVLEYLRNLEIRNLPPENAVGYIYNEEFDAFFIHIHPIERPGNLGYEVEKVANAIVISQRLLEIPRTVVVLNETAFDNQVELEVDFYDTEIELVDGEVPEITLLREVISKVLIALPQEFHIQLFLRVDILQIADIIQRQGYARVETVLMQVGEWGDSALRCEESRFNGSVVMRIVRNQDRHF